jgi:hypothetical protein
MRVEDHIEQYEFHCEPCSYEWQMAYEVRPAEEFGSGAPRFFYLNGIPATSPLAGRLCPNCWAPSHSSHRVDELTLVPARP